jgi:hypothetical protein
VDMIVTKARDRGPGPLPVINWADGVTLAACIDTVNERQSREEGLTLPFGSYFL